MWGFKSAIILDKIRLKIDKTDSNSSDLNIV